MLLLLVLNRYTFGQDVVYEPLEVDLTGSYDLLEVFQFRFKIILACIVANKLDSLLVILGWQVLLVVFNQVFES